MKNKDLKIAVAGTGYVGLSIATLLSQHHQVVAVDIVPEKVELINNKKSPIQDDYIEKYLAEKDLNLVATLDAEAAYKDADWLCSTTPTLLWLSNPRFLLAILRPSVRKWVARISSSVLNSCARARPCMTTCIRAAL